MFYVIQYFCYYKLDILGPNSKTTCKSSFFFANPYFTNLQKYFSIYLTRYMHFMELAIYEIYTIFPRTNNNLIICFFLNFHITFHTKWYHLFIFICQLIHNKICFVHSFFFDYLKLNLTYIFSIINRTKRGIL